MDGGSAATAEGAASGEVNEDEAAFVALAEIGQRCATRFQDFSETDQEQIRRINLIQLAALIHRDDTQIRPVLKKKKRKKKKGACGGLGYGPLGCDDRA